MGSAQEFGGTYTDQKTRVGEKECREQLGRPAAKAKSPLVEHSRAKDRHASPKNEHDREESPVGVLATPLCGPCCVLVDQVSQGRRLGLVGPARHIPSLMPVGHEAGPDAAVCALWVFVEDEGVTGGIAESLFEGSEVGNYQLAGAVVATEVDGDSMEAGAGVDRCAVFDEIRSGCG